MDPFLVWLYGIPVALFVASVVAGAQGTDVEEATAFAFFAFLWLPIVGLAVVTGVLAVPYFMGRALRGGFKGRRERIEADYQDTVRLIQD